MRVCACAESRDGMFPVYVMHAAHDSELDKVMKRFFGSFINKNSVSLGEPENLSPERILILSHVPNKKTEH
jgi:hypothetical protein